MLRSIFWVVLAFFALHYVTKMVRQMEKSTKISTHNSEMLEVIQEIQASPLRQEIEELVSIIPEREPEPLKVNFFAILI